MHTSHADAPLATTPPSYGTTAYKAWVLFLLFCVYTLYALDRSIIHILVEPIKKELNLSDSQMGMIGGPAFSLFFALFGIPLGILADRSNRRNLIAASVAIWSLATAACGLAQGFVHMIIGRMAVGAAVAGAPPASMAIISDVYPPERRATAMAVFYVGGAVGAALAFGVGGWIAAHYGWRAALYAAGIPGALLMALLFFTVREPRRGLSEARTAAAPEVTPPRVAFQFIARQGAVIHMLLGLVFLHAIGSGAVAFFGSFMIRSHGMTLSEAGAMISLLMILTTPFSQLLAGVIADYLGRFDIRWRIRLGWIGSLGSVCGITAMMLVESKIAMGFAFACWAFSTGLYQAPIYALLQTLVKPTMRGTVGSIQFVLTSAIGQALGPLFVGALSDLLKPQFGVESLRYAILSLGMFYLWAAAHFMLGERHVKSNLARVQQA